MLVGELHHPRREGRGEEQRLPPVVWRAATEDPAQVANEAHVEHPVRLVDNQDFDVPERRRPLLLVVEEAAGRADQEIRDLPQEVPLPVVVDPAEDRERRQPRVSAEDLGVVADLHDELPSRGNDQGPRSAAPLPWNVSEKPGEDRDQESRGLAGAGLSLTRDVRAGERDRKGFFLDGCRPGEPGVGDAPPDLVREIVRGQGSLAEMPAGAYRLGSRHEGIVVCKLGSDRRDAVITSNRSRDSRRSRLDDSSEVRD